MQTIICTTIFYGYGLGLYSKLGIFGGIVFGIVVYSLQCAFSIAYLKKFKRGHSKQYCEHGQIGHGMDRLRRKDG